jgi:KUP system potassium uptake protein
MEANRKARLTLAAMGVVFGDIGTSPLYTLRACFAGSTPVEPTPFAVFGVLSLIFYAILVIVTLKYVAFVMRADNRGEGGLLALMAMAMRGLDQRPWLSRGMMLLGLVGTALFYGDGMITPAISVLSAVEGLEVAAPGLKDFVLPLSIAVLVGLFLLQSHGTARVGTLFGPVTAVWFIVIAVLGGLAIADRPQVLGALSPTHAIAFAAQNPGRAFLVLGGVVLAVTGAEALYADMGHFGKGPIRLAWFGLVFPALTLNYFGQGALLLAHPEALANPFYLLAPSWALYPLIGLATVATVIASQAVISGAFSLSRQAMQLSYCPRLYVLQTSEYEIGQIFVPRINDALMLAVLGLVIGFGSSTALAAAYGIAVTGTMACTTIMACVVARRVWHWPRPAVALIGGTFLLIDLTFFSSNLLKIPEGGWFPLVAGSIVLVLMTTWKTGKELVARRTQENALPLDQFLARLQDKPMVRVPGTAVYMARNPGTVPTALLHNLKHNKVLHERVLILTVRTLGVPRLAEEERCHIRDAGQGFYRLAILFGFMEEPDVPAVLTGCAPRLSFDMMEASFFISRETVIPTALPGMALWREKLFAAMQRNAASAPDFFHIPYNRVIELGAQVEI